MAGYMGFAEEMEKINISNALKAKPSTSLLQVLKSLKREELLSMAKEWELLFRLKPNKGRVISRLLKFILNTERIENALLISEPNEYEFFLWLMEEEYIQESTITMGRYGYLMDQGIIFLFYDGKSLTFLIPGDIKEAVRGIDKTRFEPMLNRHQAVYKYISALTNLYGVFSREKLIEIFNHYNKQKLDMDEFSEIYENLCSREQTFYEYDKYIVDDYFDEDNFDELEGLLEKTYGLPYYFPSEKIISLYAQDRFEMTPQLKALRDFAANNMCSDEQMVEYLVDDVELLCSMEEPVKNIINEFERRGIYFKDMEQFKLAMALISDVYDHVRTWSNRGHTYAEIRRLTGKNSPRRFIEPVEAVVGNKKIIHKAGRNDSCLCGSGKKFKNCCGG